jgi:hypothetical protein
MSAKPNVELLIRHLLNRVSAAEADRLDRCARDDDELASALAIMKRAVGADGFCYDRLREKLGRESEVIPSCASLAEPVLNGAGGQVQSNFTEMVILKRWSDLENGLRPFLPELLRFVGLDETRSEGFLEFLLGRARAHRTGLRFRDLLPDWLEAFAEQEQIGPPSRCLNPEAWQEFIERTAARLVLTRKVPNEPEWAGAFRARALRGAESWRDISLIPNPVPPTAALLRFQRDLIARARQVHGQAALVFEVDVKAA